MAKISFVKKQGPRGIGQYIQWKNEDTVLSYLVTMQS